MTPEFFLAYPLKGAMSILPANMDAPGARAMVIAICLQESRLQFRRQVGGPARGFAQFEQGGGVTGVFNHPSTAALTKVVCASLDVSPTIASIYNALEQNDVLVAALARLLLWTLPGSLPAQDNPEAGWQQYVAAWRPGKPHRETWDANYLHAWNVVKDASTVDQAGVDALHIKEAAISLITSLDVLKSRIAGLIPLV